MREHPAQAMLRAATDRLEHGGMRTSPEAAALVGFLVETIGAKRVLEVGCFTGHGTLAIALAMPPDGQVVTLRSGQQWSPDDTNDHDDTYRWFPATGATELVR